MIGLHTKENGTVSWNGNVIAIDKELSGYLCKIAEIARQAPGFEERLEKVIISTNLMREKERFKRLHKTIDAQDELIKAGAKQAQEIFNKNHDLGFENGLLEEEIAHQKEAVAELEKLILMIHKRGQLDFDDEGWDLYDKVINRIKT